MASVSKMPAFAVYQSQFSKRIIDVNSDSTNGVPETSAKRQKTTRILRKKAVKKTFAAKGRPNQEEEASVTMKESYAKKGRRGRKKKPANVEPEKSDELSESVESEKDSEEHSESSGEHSIEDSKSGGSSNSSGFVHNPQCVVSREYTCGTEAAEEVFKWLLSPFPPARFYETKFEKGPYYLKRNNASHYKGLFSSQDFNKIMKENRLEYNKEIDVVAYRDGERKPMDSGTIVHPDFVWNCYNGGFSVRMRNPQAYHQPLWQLCSLLQEYFSSSVGANMYLTPAFSQGFPPHWDDIDAFILQLEGKKLWKVYHPRNDTEEFPQLSSADLDQESIGQPILEQEIKAGDLLYIPRGYIHQAEATDEYSLHITISTNQQNTWSDFLHHGLEAALEKATMYDVELRKSIPKDFFDFAGTATPQLDPDLDSKQRCAFRRKATKLAEKVLELFDIDRAADVHAAHFLHGSMRPCFSREEAMCSIHGNGNKFQNGKVRKISSLTLNTGVRWIRKRAFRLVVDEEGPKLFHTLANGKNFKEVDTAFLDVDETAVPAVSALFKKHPEYIKVKDLPVEGDLADKMQFADTLYYNGFLVTDKPLPPEDV